MRVYIENLAKFASLLDKTVDKFNTYNNGQIKIIGCSNI